MTYTIRYCHGSGTPGTLMRSAGRDRDIVRYVRKLVADGYRNETWATVEVDGGCYTARNVRGRPVGHLEVMP